MTGYASVQLQPDDGALWCMVLLPPGGRGMPQVHGPYPDIRLAMRDAAARNSHRDRPPGTVLAHLARMVPAANGPPLGSSYQLPEPPEGSILRLVDTAGAVSIHHVPGGGWCFLHDEDTAEEEAAAMAAPFPWRTMRQAIAVAEDVTVLRWGDGPVAYGQADRAR